MVFQVPLPWLRNNLQLQLKSDSVLTQTLSQPMPAAQLVLLVCLSGRGHAKADFQTYQVNCSVPCGQALVFFLPSLAVSPPS